VDLQAGVRRIRPWHCPPQVLLNHLFSAVRERTDTSISTLCRPNATNYWALLFYFLLFLICCYIIIILKFVIVDQIFTVNLTFCCFSSRIVSWKLWSCVKPTCSWFLNAISDDPYFCGFFTFLWE
jgi:hypothetical protein